MNYKAIYDNLMLSRKERPLIEGVYYERHHIVMKSLGGSNDETNLVWLTAKEHFIAHRLLWHIHKNDTDQKIRRSVAGALHCLCKMMNTRLERYNVSPRAFAESREAWALSKKGISTGPLKQERKDKISAALKNKKKSKEHCENLKKSHVGTTGKKYSDDSKLKMSISMTGLKRSVSWKHSAETIERMKNAQSNRKNKHSL